MITHRVHDSSPHRVGRTALAVLAAVTLVWLAWLAWSAWTGHAPSSASVPHAPHSPWHWTTGPGLYAALAPTSAATMRNFLDIDASAPIMYPDTMWSERQLDRVSEWMRGGDSTLGTLGRTVLGAPAIGALGITFHGENGLRAWGEPFVAWGRNR